MSPTLSFLLEHVGSQLEVLEEMSTKTDNSNSQLARNTGTFHCYSNILIQL